jgi:hypothetical protein
LPTAHDGPWPRVPARMHRLAPYPRAAVVRRGSQFLSSPSQQPLSPRHCALSIIVHLCSKHRTPPLGAIATSSCACLSSSTGGQLRPSQPPLGADQMPHDAARFLDDTGLAVVSHLQPRSEAISFPSSSGTHRVAHLSTHRRYQAAN